MGPRSHRPIRVGLGQAEDNYSKLGGAVKTRFLDTEIKVGDVFPVTPVVQYGDSRLLPESFRGVTAYNTSVEGLVLQGGRLHAMSQPSSSSMRDDFATFYAPNDNLGFSLYTSCLKDA